METTGESKSKELKRKGDLFYGFGFNLETVLYLVKFTGQGTLVKIKQCSANQMKPLFFGL